MSDNFFLHPKLQIVLNGCKAFAYSFMAHWYLLVAIPAIWAAFWFMKNLDDSNRAKRIYNFIDLKLSMIVEISRKCTAEALKDGGSLKDFFVCADNINS